MLHLFLGLKSLVKVSRYHTDGSVFRLHYRITVMALLAFTFIVTTRQYIGSPIMCVHTRDIPKDVLNTYCWIHPTYTLSSAHWKRVGVDVPHPGVDKTRDDRDKKHVKYYQWVGFCLFFQVSANNITVNSVDSHNLLITANNFLCGRSKGSAIINEKPYYCWSVCEISFDLNKCNVCIINSAQPPPPPTSSLLHYQGKLAWEYPALSSYHDSDVKVAGSSSSTGKIVV